MIPLIGYTNKLSARPGDSVDIKVSSTFDTPYHAELVRILSGDPNPNGPGVVTEPISADFAGDYTSRSQATHLGSHMISPLAGSLSDVLTLSATVWPTTPDKSDQGIIVITDNHRKVICGLYLSDYGIEARVGDISITTGALVNARRWYKIWATIDAASGTLTVGSQQVDTIHPASTATTSLSDVEFSSAAHLLVATADATSPSVHYNGKIEAPTLSNASSILATWDFSKYMSSFTVPGFGPLASDGTLFGAPARAMTGSTWNGSEMNWQNAPDQYGAIHFHDDDIADCGWDTDFTMTVPDNLPSGAYAIKLTCDDSWDYLPLLICPPQGTQSADVCVVLSTFTYVIYANQARTDFGQHWRERAAAWGAFPHNPVDHQDYGLSTYNDHNDGSGICHTTWHRPILNLRPGYHVFGDDYTGSGLRHFPADLHLLSWLAAKDIAFDIVTDWELHQEGCDLLTPYKTVLTGSHPEYHTTETLDAFHGYKDAGGNLVYLGGNGFYWRVAMHSELDGLIEIRRAEGGLRAWAADPGEYYHAFDGDYGGLWRRNGRPPNTLTGVGYTCQGDFEGTHYRRTDASRDPAVSWIFNGIEGDIIGDFGLNGGGAAGYELDRADTRLGTPYKAVVVAQSEDHPDSFVMPPEEWLTHVKTAAGPPARELIRADMTYFETSSGGAVFSSGSITFCGSLPTNNFDNNVSRLLENVVRRFVA